MYEGSAGNDRPEEAGQAAGASPEEQTLSRERPAEPSIAPSDEYPMPPTPSAYTSAEPPQQPVAPVQPQQPVQPAQPVQSGAEPYPAQQPGQPAAEPYPTQQYPAQAYPAEPYGGGTSTQQYPTGPYGTPAFGAGDGGSGQPPQGPGFGPAPMPGGGNPRRKRGLAVTGLVLAAALVGGVVGGLIVHATTHSGTTTVSSAFDSSGTGTNTSNTAPATGNVEKVAQSLLPSTVNISYSTSSGTITGSGVILTSDGEILTNNHVVADAATGGVTITVTFNDGSTTTASILGRDSIFDLAVIKAKNETSLKPVSFGSSSSLVVGQEVVAIGSPLGLQGTVTSGIVSALQRPVNTTSSTQTDTGSTATTVIDAIQTDAAINPGNSGGPLVDMNGKVVGINAAIATASDTTGTGSQSGSIGIGFAIPIDEAQRIASVLATGKQPVHAQLAVSVSEGATPSNNGATISAVTAGGPAASAGIQANDVITKVNSRVIPDADALIAAIREYQPGAQVTVTYLRGGTSHTATVTLCSASDSSN